jgi:DNA-binding GntR family transcriptional regulator
LPVESTGRIGAVQRQSFADTAYAELLSRITRLQIPPGTSFTEGQIALELGLSKTPVREALTRLRQEGFVVIDHTAGYRASDVTIKDTRDLFALLALLEGEVAWLAAGQTLHTSDLRELEELCEKDYNPANPASADSFLEANTRLHLAISKAAGNQRLAQVLDVIRMQMERLFRIALLLHSRSDGIDHGHRELMEAIVSGDPELARKVAVAHVRTSQRVVIDALVSSDAVTTRPIGLPQIDITSNG